MNIDKIIRISEFLDKKGIYKEADKLDALVKVAQYVSLPSGYRPTETSSGNPFIDNLTKGLEGSSFGYQAAGNNQYNMTGAYKSKYGPEGPLVLPTLTPAQQAKMEAEGRYQDIANIMMRGGFQVENYLRNTNDKLIGLSTLMRQYNQSNVSPEYKKQFFANMPSTAASLAMQDLSVKPLSEWDDRINEYMEIVSKEAAPYLANFKQSIKQALTQRALDIRYKNPSQYAALLKDKNWKALSVKFGVNL
jgi:hypothetical protein